MSVAHGIHDPSSGTPARRPGSVRRTTSLDLRRSAPTGPMDFVGRARDLLTGASGSATVLDQVEVRGSIAPSGELVAIDASPTALDVETLIGASVRSGFRARMDEALPDHRDRRTALHLLLDDLPIVFVVSGYGDMRERPATQLPPRATGRMVDLCAGWQAGATMMLAIEHTGVVPMPVGSHVPDLTPADDPVGWHDLPPVERGELRRQRRLDLAPGDPLRVEAMFRDSHRAMNGSEVVLHEYEVTATVDPITGEVRSSSATPRVLPWPECPQAAASAARIVGQPASSLRAHVLDELTGIETCTHLNDILRSLADVVALRSVLA